MGVQDLWRILAPCAKEVNLQALVNRRLAIDTSIWLTAILRAMQDEKGRSVQNAHLVGLFHRIMRLLYLGVRPVFVFDGPAPQAKRDTLRKRAAQRHDRSVDIQTIARRLALSQLRARALESLKKSAGKPSAHSQEPSAPAFISPEDLAASGPPAPTTPLSQVAVSHLPRTPVHRTPKAASATKTSPPGAQKTSPLNLSGSPPGAERRPTEAELDQMFGQEASGVGGRWDGRQWVDDPEAFRAEEGEEEEEGSEDAAEERAEWAAWPGGMEAAMLDEDQVAWAVIRATRQPDSVSPGDDAETERAGETGQDKSDRKTAHEEAANADQAQPRAPHSPQKAPVVDVESDDGSVYDTRDEDGEVEDAGADGPLQLALLARIGAYLTGDRTIEGPSLQDGACSPAAFSAYQLAKTLALTSLRAKYTTLAAAMEEPTAPGGIAATSPPGVVAASASPSPGGSGVYSSPEGSTGTRISGSPESAVASPQEAGGPRRLLVASGRVASQPRTCYYLYQTVAGEVPGNAQQLHGEEKEGELAGADQQRRPQEAEEVQAPGQQSPQELMQQGGQARQDGGPAVMEKGEDEPALDLEDFLGDLSLSPLPPPPRPAPAIGLGSLFRVAGDVGCCARGGPAPLALPTSPVPLNISTHLTRADASRINSKLPRPPSRSPIQLQLPHLPHNHPRAPPALSSATRFAAPDDPPDPRGHAAAHLAARLPRVKHLHRSSAQERTTEDRKPQPQLHLRPQSQGAPDDVRPLPVGAGPTVSPPVNILNGDDDDQDRQALALALAMSLRDTAEAGTHRLEPPHAAGAPGLKSLSSSTPQVTATIPVSTSPPLSPSPSPGPLPPAGAPLSEIEAAFAQEDQDLEAALAKGQRQLVSVTAEARHQCMRMLELFGIPYVVAAGEAEAQCAAMQRWGLVDAVVTEDSDCLVFGAGVVLRGMMTHRQGEGPSDPGAEEIPSRLGHDVHRGQVRAYVLSELGATLGLYPDDLIDLACLLGCDYDPGLRGVGPIAAMEILALFGGGRARRTAQEERAERERGGLGPGPPLADPLVAFLEWVLAVAQRKSARLKIVSVESDSLIQDGAVGTALHTLRHRLVLDPANFPPEVVRRSYRNPNVRIVAPGQLRWGGLPSLDGLCAFAQEHMGWHRERCEQMLVPLIRRLEADRAQGGALGGQLKLDLLVIPRPSAGSRGPTATATATAAPRRLTILDDDNDEGSDGSSKTEGEEEEGGSEKQKQKKKRAAPSAKTKTGRQPGGKKADKRQGPSRLQRAIAALKGAAAGGVGGGSSSSAAKPGAPPPPPGEDRH
ncbi:putative Rad2 protein [Paratrimastix pyriformis]|uniref:Rad2 protein n=1 Tax=Paratrimastix pyriformis TaxID=342808 RepID=A0ABQ8UPD8_9EUKA|nr:putative Rad2 protein [Paratrimastix pyriformis]